MATVELQNVSKVHNANTIIENLSIGIEKGEFIVVVGPSGCGKTTLLRLIAGLDSVTSGKILLNKKCINTIAPKERDIAMVFQHYALYPHMTVYKNIAYGLLLRKYPKNIIQQRVTEVAEMLGLTAYLHRKPLSLSGGQKQRVAMGRAMVRQPALFLFDEPLSNLDANLRSKMRYEMKKLHQQLAITSLYVTHDQMEAMTLATRLIVLNQGKIEQVGTPSQIYQEPASLFVAQFMGYYPLNIFSSRVDNREQKLVTSLGSSFPFPPLWNAMEEQEVLVAIRPEHMSLHKHTGKDLPLYIDSVDNMGADKLLTVKDKEGNFVITIKTTEEASYPLEQAFSLQWSARKGSIFDTITGKRLGGWNDNSITRD